MRNTPIERLNYFSGQALLTRDFQTEQSYHINVRRYYNQALNSPGIANGLELDWQPGSNQLTVRQGMAIDAQGREIILLENRLITPGSDSKNGHYFVAIAYNEVLTDYQDHVAATGYKRVLQQPDIEFIPAENGSRNWIILGVVNIQNGQIAALAYQLANTAGQRTYSNATLGGVHFVLGGAGVNAGASKQQGNNDALVNNPSISVQRYQYQATGQADASIQTWDWLTIDAPKIHFTGYTTMAHGLGIGTNFSNSYFQVNASVIDGNGTISTDTNNARLIWHDQGQFSPGLQPGDILILPATVHNGASQATVLESGNNYVKIDLPFPSAVSGAPYQYRLGKLVSINNDAGNSVFEISSAGNVGLGLKSYPQAGSVQDEGLSTLYISDGKVGIGLAQAPSTLLEVGGDLKSNGVVMATSFIGDGSQLKNVISLWHKYNTEQKIVQSNDDTPIYYNAGNVAIGMPYSPAKLGVAGGEITPGSGIITSVNEIQNGKTLYKLIGYQTKFQSELSENDEIIVGVYSEDNSYNKVLQQAVVSLQSNTSLTIDQAFATPFKDQSYDLIKITTQKDGSTQQTVIEGQGAITTDGVNPMVTGQGSAFQTQISPDDDTVTWKIQPKNVFMQRGLIRKIVSDTELYLHQPFSPMLTDSQYYIGHVLLAQFANTNTAQSAVLVVRSNTTPMVNNPEQPQAVTEQSAVALTNVNSRLTQNTALNPSLLAGSIANQPSGKTAPGTVGINVDVPDPAYALEVSGDVWIEGTINTPQAGMVPNGAICMWQGSLTDVPHGWALCDGGTYGELETRTPDLRNRFILGWGDKTIGSTGGEENVTLTLDQIPVHNHNVQATQDPHSHEDYVRHATINYGGGASEQDIADWGSGHYTDTVQPTIQVTQEDRGGGQPHNNMPPYYVLAYIMKIPTLKKLDPQKQPVSKTKLVEKEKPSGEMQVKNASDLKVKAAEPVEPSVANDETKQQASHDISALSKTSQSPEVEQVERLPDQVLANTAATGLSSEATVLDSKEQPVSQETGLIKGLWQRLTNHKLNKA